MIDLRCAVTGKGPLLIACSELLLDRGSKICGVISDCNEVAGWCQRQGIALIGTRDDQHQFLSGQPLDYLFSIVNHNIIPPEILSIPGQGAINYHDSSLPNYAGFNATSWAIIDGELRHGITWHRMADSVDNGDILVSESIPIADEDTAFTLTTKCGEAAVRGFAKLLDMIQSGALQGTPQSEPENFHLRSERPGVGLLNWSMNADQVHRFVRGLDFGPDSSWMTTPKVFSPSGDYIRVGTATVIDGGLAAEPGTVTSVHDGNIGVTVADGVLALAELSTLVGQSLDASDLAAMGLEKGAQLFQPDDENLAPALELDARTTRNERFWLNRLTTFAPTQLSELTLHDKIPSISRVTSPLPQEVTALCLEDRRTAVLSAIAVYLHATGEGSGLVSLGFMPDRFAAFTLKLFSDSTPLLLEVDSERSWQDLVEAAKAELEIQERRETFALDIVLRYPELRSDNPFAERKPVLASYGLPGELASGTHLCIDLNAEGMLEAIYDSQALTASAARNLLSRLSYVLAQGSSGSIQVGSILIVPEEERNLLLDTWQQTAAPYPSDNCVHQLFEYQAQQTPEATALVYRSEQISYSDLNDKADALASHLQGLGIGPDELVGVCIERSIDMMVALLGVMKAGGAYVPMDPAYPAERLGIMLEDSKAKVLVTQKHIQSSIPDHGVTVLLIEDTPVQSNATVNKEVGSDNLAYVIFTSGSTGRPKGVMVEHRNVCNFFTGMDAVLGTEPGVWLAVTSISFDISVLELFWTLSRGFKVIIQEEGDRASMMATHSVKASNTPMGFGLFYFAADSTDAANRDAYKVLLDGARFADSHGFVSVWTPERHFHAFGGLYPNPAVTSAALAVATKNLEIRAGSVVLPLHNPIRVAEDWAVVDNLSGGRVGLSFASGWHANDFALMPENFERRRELMSESIETVLKLWRGEKITVANGEGKDIEVGVLPRPVRERPPMWVASAGNVETFKIAGRAGHNILTNMLGQDLKDLETKFAAYREARKEHGHEGKGIISVMLHTFVCDDDDKAREIAREPFCNYMASSYDLVKVAPWMFPAFKQPSQGGDAKSAFDPESFDDDDMRALLDHAFERYFETAGLFGTPETALAVVEQLKSIGATEVACLVDFGIDQDVVLENLVHLDRLRQLANPVMTEEPTSLPVSVSEQLASHHVTHLQCTPSMARLLLADGSVEAMGSLQTLLLGGEALPRDLVQKIAPKLGGRIINMYGPTETTIWSTTSPVDPDQRITIGKPIANTVIRILDQQGRLCPVGTAGELCIGGDSVVRGYLAKPELTQERFIADPYHKDARLYRTGDLARYLESGELDYLGRIDQQVKLNGYRMELGEIETVMAKHPSVHEAVVAVKGDDSHPQLVGYFVPQGGKSTDSGTEQDITTWGERWNEAYERRTGAENATTRFNASGWLNSFTGGPLSQEEMREWLDHTLSLVEANTASYVLELGCGTGMILFGCLDKVSHFTGLDLSSHALNTIRQELSAEERGKVTLFNKAAHEIADTGITAVDTVVINSVAQYFPDADYLTKVLDSAAAVVSDGGRIFVGDVRNLRHLAMFHTLIEIHQAPGLAESKALNASIAERIDNETELVLSPYYFQTWLQQHPEWTLQSLSMKRTQHQNEMTMFRYDVVLVKSNEGDALELDGGVESIERPDSLDAVQAELANKPSLMLLTDIENPRLTAVAEITSRLNASDSINADFLRDLLSLPARGIDPAALASISEDYTVEMRWHADADRYDALFRHKTNAPLGYWPLSGDPVQALANTPATRVGKDSVVPKLRKHLKDFLPEYMIPSTFVTVDAFPLTPNGKIDRNALPNPGADSKISAAPAYVVPSNDLERSIAQIWQQLLGIDKVGKRDNIFDLGASSLLTVEANNMLQTQLGRKIPLVNMFRFPTIEKLAAHLGGPPPLTAGTGAGGTGGAQAEKRDRVKAAAERRRLARARQQK